MRALTSNNLLVDSIASFPLEALTEITFWMELAQWSRGIASHALGQFLDVVRVRPLWTRAASDKAGSLRVLAKSGLQPIGTEVSFAPARRQEFEETVLQLDCRAHGTEGARAGSGEWSA